LAQVAYVEPLIAARALYEVVGLDFGDRLISGFGCGPIFILMLLGTMERLAEVKRTSHSEVTAVVFYASLENLLENAMFDGVLDDGGSVNWRMARLDIPGDAHDPTPVFCEELNYGLLQAFIASGEMFQNRDCRQA
jgi:hypothetical protein